VSDPYEFTLEELLASIEEAVSPQTEDGFYTAAEWAKIWDKQIAVTRQAIAKLLAANRMEHGIRYETSLLDGRSRRKDTFRLCGKE